MTNDRNSPLHTSPRFPFGQFCSVFRIKIHPSPRPTALDLARTRLFPFAP